MNPLKIVNVYYSKKDNVCTKCVIKAVIDPEYFGHGAFEDIDSGVNFITETAVARLKKGDTWDEELGKRIAKAKAIRKAYDAYNSKLKKLRKKYMDKLNKVNLEISNTKRRKEKHENFIIKLNS